MGKWFAAVAATVVGGLLYLWLTKFFEPSLPSFPRLAVSVANVSSGKRIDSLRLWAGENDLIVGGKLFGAVGKAESSEAYPRPYYQTMLKGLATGQFTVSNEGSGRARMCRLYWTTNPSGLVGTNSPAVRGNYDFNLKSWVHSDVFDVRRDQEVNLSLSLKEFSLDHDSISFYRAYCENGTSEMGTVEVF